MSYYVEWIPGLSVLGTVLILLIVPGFALIGLAVVALGAVAALVALAGAVIAMPYLLVRSLVGASRSGTSQRKARRRSPPQSHGPQAPPTASALSPSRNH